MNAFAKGIPWLAFLLCLSHLACFHCAEEEALLLEDKDFCTVPGAADVKACDWIVEQLEDQNPGISYNFFCSKEEDCDSEFVEGEVVDWFSGGCNGPKIINKLCGCCVFKRNVAPGPPTNLAASEVTTSSATITWTDGAMGFPLETYAVRCFEEEPEDCRSPEFAVEATGIPRGVEEVTLSDLDPNTEYSCFVLAVNSVAPDGICSDALAVTTLPLQNFKLALVLTVDNCDAFGEPAVVEAYCEAFIEEAGFPEETACLTEESSCVEVVIGRRRLLVEEFEATIVLAGDFEGQDQEEVEAAANAVLDDEVRFSNVQSAAIVLLTDRGTEDLADALGNTNIADATSSAEDADPECTTSDDCGDPLAPVCRSGFCVACGPIQGPAVQGSCPEAGTLCQIDGSCLPILPTTASFEVDVLLDDCAGARFLDWCKLDERENGVTRITSNVPMGGPDSALETTTTCDNADKASGFGVFAPVGLFNGITFEEFVENLDTLGYELFKSRDTGCTLGNEESAPRLEIVVNGPVGQERRTTSFTLEPTYTVEFNNGPVTNNEWIEISSGPDDGTVSSDCTSDETGSLGFYTTGFSSVFGFTGFFLDFRCSLSSWIETLKNEGFSSFVEEGTIVGLTFSLGSFNAGVEGYVNGLHVKTDVFDWTWTFVATD